MSLSSNNQLGKYRIVREIARSNDIVYEAMDPQMNRRIALKELQIPPHLAGAQKRERIERFYREAKAAGTLSHPNIVTIYEVGQENDRHFIAMEYLEGQSLRSIIQMQGALPLRETLEMALQLCEALAYAHSHGVVHRDVKPDNIHILPGGIIKLTDFGIARLTAEPSITSQGQVFGTPSYMSPEQIASQTVDHRTDLFSMGIALYEMLTGRKPFPGDSVITITYNIMNLQPTMPVGVPPMLQGILQKALAKDPNLRYQTAAAFAADLRAQKFEMDAPTFHKTASMTFGVPAAGAVLDSTSANTDLFGGVTSNSHMPGRPTDSEYLPYTPPEDGGLSREARSFLGLLGSVVGVIVLLLLLIWGVSAALRAYQFGNKQRAAYRIEQTARQSLSSGDLSTAATEFDAARRTAPDDSNAAHLAVQGLASVEVTRGRQAENAGDTSDAQAAYERAIQIDSRNAAAYDTLGQLHYRQNDLEGATQYWQSAMQADPTSTYAADARDSATRVYQTLAQQASNAGNTAQALHYWGLIVQTNPGSDAARDAQAQITGTGPVTPAPQ